MSWVDCWWVVYGCGCLYCYAYWLLFLLIVLSIVVLVCALARFICFGCGLICFGFSFVVVVYLLVCGCFGLLVLWRGLYMACRLWVVVLMVRCDVGVVYLVFAG